MWTVLLFHALFCAIAYFISSILREMRKQHFDTSVLLLFHCCWSSKNRRTTVAYEREKKAHRAIMRFVICICVWFCMCYMCANLFRFLERFKCCHRGQHWLLFTWQLEWNAWNEWEKNTRLFFSYFVSLLHVVGGNTTRGYIGSCRGSY